MTTILENLSNYQKQISDEGLVYEKIALHHKRIYQSLSSDLNTELKIFQNCTLANGDIYSLETLQEISEKIPNIQQENPGYYAAFVPAAGAASRYWTDSSLQEKETQFSAIQERFNQLDLPFSYESIESVPKAFYFSGNRHLKENFLDVKRREHQALNPIREEVYICPINQRSTFLKYFQVTANNSKLSKKTHILEQDLTLSTLRFDSHAQPILQDGFLSKVPAGHGMLTQLFPKIKKSLEANIHSVFIRNIDNINGTDVAVVKFTSDFLRTHDKFLKILQKIRSFFAQGSFAKANDFASVVLKSNLIPQKNWIALPTPSIYPSLWRILIDCFALDTSRYVSLDKNLEEKLLGKLYARPLNFFGLVPNRGKDIGGSPVWVDVGSHKLRMCIEQPHCSKEDQQNFLMNPTKNTHFNPVFVASELPLEVDAYSDPESLFWILAKKTFQGKDVFYHETVLYELLGNSDLANCIFVDIPAKLFNPHKKHSDIGNHNN